MARQSTIILGGQDYPVCSMTLGQMKRAAPLSARIGFDTPENAASSITLISMAMQAANPALSVAEIEAIADVSVDELRPALANVVGLMGLKLVDAPTGDAEPGEPPRPPSPTG